MFGIIYYDLDKEIMGFHLEEFILCIRGCELISFFER